MPDSAVIVRAAGGDLVPPERRARGIAYVLAGALWIGRWKGRRRLALDAGP